MRRLEILLCGSSRGLACLADELRRMGHGAHLLDTPASYDHWQLHASDLVIDDATLAPWPETGNTWQVSLQVSGSDLSDPLQDLQLHLLGRQGSQPWQCLERQDVPAEASGNGADLVNRAVQELVEAAAAHVSGYSRHDDYFSQYRFQALGQVPSAGLGVLDTLAFAHRCNRTAAPAISEAASVPFIQRLAASLRQHHDAPALLVEGRSVSYGELHALSVAIQERLVPLLGEDRQQPVVAIALGKGVALYASILAVLGCGALYLPLDPSHPAERRALIVEHARARIVIHDDNLAIPAGCIGLDVSHLSAVHQGADGHQGIALAQHQSLLRGTWEGARPCVAIYTSGTTGTPKGVQLTVANLSHFCAWYAEHVEVGPKTRALQFSTINFDASLLDIFPTLLEGGCLVVPNEDQRRDPLALAQLVVQAEVSHAFLPPALLSILPLHSLRGMTHLITGGDVCEPHVIDALAEHCHLHNIYGPTETTVLATSRVMRAGDSNRLLGLPIANTRLYLLDEQGLPVSEGQSGEIYIAGPGVGAGYLHNPAASAERYLNGSGGLHGERLYRTGDLARWGRAGVEIIGRLDNQVKIRGFRVEPEEIEHVLRSSNLFGQQAVVIDEQRRILAFFAEPRNGDAHSATEALKAHAQQHLPDYMRPARWRLLETLPATTNGKIDRKALRLMPDDSRQRQVRAQPLSAATQSLLAIWAKLLEIDADDIGLDESFFNLGGHSILLSRMLMDIRETFAKGVSINRFIEQPTLTNLARLLEQDDTADAVVSARALADANLSVDLEVLPLSRQGDVHKVIVTGANGFLGVHLVEALLELGSSEVACLVRASPGQSAQQRFAQALVDNRLEHLDMSRVRVLAADISQPLLGLSAEEYEHLDRDYGALIYNAANVNHVLDYESLIKDNVAPLLECLKLCEGRSKKIFNFISTLSASSSIDAQGRVLETPPAATPPIYIRNGYNLSKWVGERILWNACERGVRVNIYRPGNIAFNTRTGVCQPHQNRLMLMLKGSLQLKEVPQLSLNFDLMPVDFLARFIGFHASRHTINRAVFNLHNPTPLSWDNYVEAFRHMGHDFQLVPVSRWQQRLSTIGSDNALFGVVGFYLNGFEEDIGDISMIEHGNARHGIDNMGEEYPAKSPTLLRRGCEFLKEIDFI
ncbi:amino acid adenylation domain-containing protein [Pseudomonas sp. 2(2015)]|uniref:amino acid adenylation domain-containing protein n=1 Tax=Pseudomonas sp. 2(2015) TaxID=1619950 RepID=UPI0005EB6FE1|nr:amino acid adenylation domain-containing protein [Pseudomonas sp. 2(2015)]KJK16768.1 peptide transporter [Pseudomonas sp. 2(2015)]